MSAIEVTKLLKSKRGDADERLVALFPSLTDAEIVSLAATVRGSSQRMLLDCEASAELVRRGLPTDDDLGARWLEWVEVFEDMRDMPILVSDAYPEDYDAKCEPPMLSYVTPASLLGTNWRDGLLGGFGFYASNRVGLLEWLFSLTDLVPVEVIQCELNYVAECAA